MKRPTAEKLRYAADWLMTYEDEPDGNHGELLAEVAKWLEAQADAADTRALAKNEGVSVDTYRKAEAIVLARINATK